MTAAPGSGSGQAREPAIDGLRAVCVAAILAFHQPVGWLPGGFLGVSTFFTLSGFLITRLVLTELDATATVHLGRFTARRLRRLAPAALLTVLGTSVAWAIARRELRLGDVLAAAGYVTNWRQIALGNGYERLFQAPSPLVHFWSLAVEEQFYLLFPTVVLGIHLLARRRRGVLAPALALVGAGSFVLAANVGATDAYYATPTRIGEILAGSLLALAFHSTRRAEAIGRVISCLPGRVLAIAALAVLAGTWSVVTITSSWLFPWGTMLNALLSCVLVAECVAGSGLRRILALAPFARVGRISYALYLVHWPIYLLVAPDSFPHLPPGVLSGARLGLSVLVAVLLFRVVEEPVRIRQRWRGARLPAFAAGVAAAAIAVTVVAVPRPGPSALDTTAIAAARAELLALPPVDSRAPTATTPADPPVAQTAQPTLREPSPPSASPAPGDAAGTGSAPTAATTATTAPPPATTVPGPRRVLIVGDSTAWTLSLGLGNEALEVRAFPAVGCGVGGATPIVYLNQAVSTNQGCADWLAQLPQVIDRYDPDAVLVAGGLADLSERELPDGRWAHIGDPGYDAWLATRLDELAGVLRRRGAPVGWLTLPHAAVQPDPAFTGPPPFPENDPGRADRYNALLAELAARTPGVELVDYAGYLAERPGGEFADGLRPDGVHVDTRQWPDVAEFLDTAAQRLVDSSSATHTESVDHPAEHDHP